MGNEHDKNVTVMISLTPEQYKWIKDYALIMGYSDDISVIYTAISALTQRYRAEEGYPKKAIVRIGEKDYPCWVIAPSEIWGGSYVVVQDRDVFTIRTNYVKICDDVEAR